MLSERVEAGQNCVRCLRGKLSKALRRIRRIPCSAVSMKPSRLNDDRLKTGGLNLAIEIEWSCAPENGFDSNSGESLFISSRGAVK